ncbi:MAG: hypothetical protein K0R28_5329 [Paenibacillus sp.]|nr:hypothetical protein [Paenibacillus sp.]
MLQDMNLAGNTVIADRGYDMDNILELIEKQLVLSPYKKLSGWRVFYIYIHTFALGDSYAGITPTNGTGLQYRKEGVKFLP